VIENGRNSILPRALSKRFLEEEEEEEEWTMIKMRTMADAFTVAACNNVAFVSTSPPPAVTCITSISFTVYGQDANTVYKSP